MELTIHNVCNVELEDGRNDSISSPVYWRTITVTDGQGQTFELTLFPKDKDVTNVHLKKVKSLSEQYYDDAVQDHLSEQQEEWLEEQSKTKEYEGWLDNH